MPQDESVSASLISVSDLQIDSIVGVEVVIAGEPADIILNRQRDGVLAWRNVCPHQGRKLDYVPGKFLIDRGRLVCAAHGALFRLSDGVCVGGPCRGERLQEVPVQVDSLSGVLSFDTVSPQDG